MANEKNREEDSFESQVDGEKPSGAEEGSEQGAASESLPQAEVAELVENAASETGVAELEGLAAQRDEKLSQANTHLAELEQLVAGKDSEIVALKQAMSELEAELATASKSLSEALASYKAVVVQANPEVIEELISGDSIETIEESLRQARALVSRVRQGVEAEIALAKVPAGAPERTSPDLSALSPREKIKYAIGSFSSRHR